MHAHLINYAFYSLSLNTIDNSLGNWIYTSLIITYCINKSGFFSALFFPLSPYSPLSLPHFSGGHFLLSILPSRSLSWAYDCLPDEGYIHLTVNHSLNFLDPAPTGAHTQRLENTRRGIKRSIPRTGISKDLFGSYLQEWLWRKQYGEDPLGNIIEHIAEVYDVVCACACLRNHRGWKSTFNEERKISNSTCEGKRKNDNDNDNGQL